MKVKVSMDGRINDGTWEIDQQEEIWDAPFHLELSRTIIDSRIKIKFTTPEEMKNFRNRIGLCRAMIVGTDKAVYLTLF